MNRRSVALLLLAIGIVGCGSSTSSPPGAAQPMAAAPRRDFEGLIDYRGLEGAPPGRPWSAACAMRGDVFRCDIVMEGKSSGVVGMRGSSICYRPASFGRWMRIDLATVGFLFSLLPSSMRRDAVKQAQAQTFWTGRSDRVLGRTCYELETRTSEGEVERYCYSHESFFAGADQLIPVLRQMGYDNTFIGSMSRGGIGWKGQRWDKNGSPSMYIETSRIEEHPIDPRLVDDVCR